MSSIIRRGESEHVFVQPLVIFPRVHVARNIGRPDGHAADLRAVCGEERTQAASGIEGQQLIPISKVDQDRMSAMSFVLGLNKPGSMTPRADDGADNFSGHSRMIDQSDQQARGSGVQ